MKLMLIIIACLLLLTTYSIEDTELFSTKLGHRLFTFGQMVITAHLWARDSSWKSTSLYIIGIITSFHVDTSKPHPAAFGLLLHASVALICIIMSFNKEKHVRSLSQLFSSCPPEEEHVIDADWADLPVLAPNLFENVEILDTDDSSDKDPFPPGLLDGPFIMEHSVPVAG